MQEYLVSLGVQIDRPGFQEMDRTIRESGQVVEKVTGSWAANFLKASTVIGSAIASVTAAVGGLMNSAAKSDLEIQKFARNMMISKDAALEMKRATDALGESVNDILLTPELLDGFRQLTREGRQMKIGGDFEETMKHFRDLTFEFTRLKQEASYAMTWVGYYLMKYLQRPLNEIGEKFRRFNDAFIKNMSVWTEKIARSMVYIVNIGKHLLEFLWDVGKALYDVWDSFPRGVKIAAAALAGLWTIINASPLGRMIMLVSTLLILIDDYYGYMEGKQAAFGEYWDKLNGYIETGKRLWEEYKPVVMETLDTAVAYLLLAKDAIVEFAGMAKDTFDDIVDSKGFQEFLEISWDIVQAFKELGGGILETVTSLFGSFYDGLKDNGAGKEFSGLLDRIVRFIKELYKGFRLVIQTVAKWLDEISRSDTVREFMEALGELVAVILELFNAAWDVATVALKELFAGFDDDKHAYSFRDAIKAVVKMISGMARTISTVIRKLSEFLRLMKDNTLFRKFWKGLGGAVKEFTDLVFEALKTVGKLGQALIQLTKGDFKGAAKLAGTALSDFGKRFFGKEKTKGLSQDELQYEALIQKYALDNEISPNLLRALIKAESSFNPNAVSDVGAIGLGQLMSDTAKGLGVEDPYDPEQNIMGTAKYLAGLLREFNGDERKAIAAYNAGPNAVKEYGGIPPYRETQNHVEKVMSYKQDYDSRTSSADARQNNLAGDAVAENAMNYTVGSQWMGGATDDWRIQCDSFTANVYNESGIPSIGGHSTDNSAGHVINDTAFKDANAWHENDGYIPQNGDLVGWNWSETSGHYGIYNADADTVITRDSKGGIQHRTLQEAIDYWGAPTGYGSISEAEAHRNGIVPTESAVPDYESDNQTLVAFAGLNLPEMVDRELLEKFEEFVYVLRQNGYDIYTQSASRNSIGFTSSGDDWWNIKDMAEHYGMSATYDDNGGYYVSLPHSAIPTASFMPDYEIQPLGAYRRPEDNISGRQQDDAPSLAEIQKMVENGILTPIRKMIPREQNSTLPASFQGDELHQKPTVSADIVVPIVESIKEGFRGVSISLPKIELPELPKIDMPEIPPISIQGIQPEQIAGMLSAMTETMQPYMQDMAAGLPQYVSNDNATTNNSTINNTIGDIHVTVEGGANASAQEIARAARQEIFDRVQRDGNFLFGSRSLIGNMM